MAETIKIAYLIVLIITRTSYKLNERKSKYLRNICLVEITYKRIGRSHYSTNEYSTALLACDTYNILHIYQHKTLSVPLLAMSKYHITVFSFVLANNKILLHIFLTMASVYPFINMYSCNLKRDGLQYTSTVNKAFIINPYIYDSSASRQKDLTVYTNDWKLEPL